MRLAIVFGTVEQMPQSEIAHRGILFLKEPIHYSIVHGNLLFDIGCRLVRPIIAMCGMGDRVV
jgi:hypothetical protein